MKAPTSETVSLTIRVVLRRVEGHWHVASHLIEPHHDGWPDEPEAFGQAIRVARLREGIGVDEFADLVGVTPQTIRNIETARNPPTRAARGWVSARQ